MADPSFACQGPPDAPVRARRVMIIGGSGSGKSTTARAIGEKLGLPVFHMDREVHWLPGWVERDKAEKTPIVEAIVAREEWVFEGGHSSTYPQRLARADLLVWTDAPFWLRLWRVTWRCLRDWGKTRPDMAEGCPEHPRQLPEFWRFLRVNRRRIDERLAATFAAADLPKVHLRSFREIDAFVSHLGRGAGSGPGKRPAPNG